ncbi:mesenchyme-specific cell surface glycoprotein [Patella vulgata]|uniref:mesenchyme-specific cell surface glycoprotein n=1 Tax=Patella vulgata TaxID=6465 RepID=UPI00217FF609|nr:mesenchyme-specific cell surface glycoprotein [Patella vulgata]
MFLSAVLLTFGLACSQAAVVVNVTSYLRLSDHLDRLNLFGGNADAMAYDVQEQLLYVIGSSNDMLNVVDVADKLNLRVPFKHHFSEISDGLPLDVAVCRYSGLNDVARLAISFADRDLTYEGHIEIFDLLDRNNLVLTLRERIPVQPDPKSIKFTEECDRLVVACESKPGARLGNFYDPVGHVDVIQLNAFGSSTVHKLDFGPDNSQIRQVYSQYTGSETIVNDLEPETVVIGSNHTAYVILQENNAMGGFLIDNINSPIQLYDLGSKDFSQYDVDTSDQDLDDSPSGDGINLVRRNVRGFYQPGDVAVFVHNGEDYLITADQGAVKEYTAAVEGVDFQEAVRGRTIPDVDLDVDDTTRQDLSNNAAMGRLYVSGLKQASDGFDPIISNKFNSIRTYGARGFSIWRPSDLTHVYESGGEFEYYMREAYSSVFNGDCNNGGRTPPQDKDLRSDDKGPEPSSVATGLYFGRRVAVIGSGRSGALFVYTIESPDATSPPTGNFQSVFRPGSITGSWSDLYQNDLAGHPIISDIEIVENADGTADVFVLGAATGSLSIYSINEVL